MSMAEIPQMWEKQRTDPGWKFQLPRRFLEGAFVVSIE